MGYLILVQRPEAPGEWLTLEQHCATMVALGDIMKKHYLVEVRMSGCIESYNVWAYSEYDAIQEALDRAPAPGRVGRVTLIE